MRFTWPYQALITLFVSIMFLDAATLTPRKEHAKNLHDSSRFEKVSRLFPHCFNSGAKTLRKFVKKNLRERQEALDCLMQENVNNIHDMIRGNISPDRFNTTKSTLMKDGGKYFDALLGIDNEANAIPTEIVENVLDYLQPEKAPSWDSQTFLGDLAFRDNDRTVYTVEGSWGGGLVQSAQPCSRFSVQIVKSKMNRIGFAKRYGNTVYPFWLLDILDGTLLTRDFANMPYANGGIPVGSIVTAFHDSHRNTIEFEVNGTSLGIAFSNIPYRELYTTAFIFGHPAEIRIMNNT